MSDYNLAINWVGKDALSDSDPDKVVSGSDLNTEFTAVKTAVNTKANINGSACSQHIDDRLPFFRQQGIEPVLLTGPVGERAANWIHFRAHSLSPSGIRFEVRHFLRKRFHKRWQFKLAETVLLLPVFPFYLVEKIIINLESEWSWFFLASLRGFFLCKTLEPDVIYSTGGSASAHVAALLIKNGPASDGSQKLKTPWFTTRTGSAAG